MPGNFKNPQLSRRHGKPAFRITVAGPTSIQTEHLSYWPNQQDQSTTGINAHMQDANKNCDNVKTYS